MSLNESLTALVSTHGIDAVKTELDTVINTIIKHYISVLNQNGYRVEPVKEPVQPSKPPKEPVVQPAKESRDIKDILTVENVKRWLEEGNSYAWIAKEKVGCKQELISKFAKVNGLQKSKRQSTPDN